MEKVTMVFVSPPGMKLTEAGREGNINLARSRNFISPHCKEVKTISGNEMNNPAYLSGEIKLGRIICVPERSYSNLIHISLGNIVAIKKLLSENPGKTSYELLLEYAMQNSGQ